MERHCTAHLKRGVTLRTEILNCLKGKGCSGRWDGSWFQPCWKYLISSLPIFPGIPSSHQCRSTDRRPSHPNRNNQDIHCTREDGGNMIFSPSTQNFLQILFCPHPPFFPLSANSLRALSRWCSCLMYFIFPRIACSWCEKCQLFWETWNQVGKQRNYSWGHHEEEGYFLHPDGRRRAQPAVQS